MNFKLEPKKKFKTKNYEYFVIGADIGGTNTRIGFAGVKNDVVDLLFSLEYSSYEFKSLATVLKHAKKNAKDAFGITVKRVCLACAGPITKNGNFCEMTNASWNVDRRRLIAQTRLRILPLINDLEAVSNSLSILRNKDLERVHSGKTEKGGRKVVVAASTGLGKCMIHEEKGKLITIPSEFGNNDFSIVSEEDLKLAEFIKKNKKTDAPIQYEDVVSGPGIENIYEFLSKRKKSIYKKEILNAKVKSAAIFAYQKKDSVCRDTIKQFAKYYGRFIKNVAFDDLPLGGIYQFGGIPTNHPELFGKEFMKEFTRSETHQKLLKSMPIYVILNDDAGIIGACAVASRE